MALDDPEPIYPFLGAALTAKTATILTGKSPDTVSRWCHRHKIGQQLHPHAPWAVDAVGLAIVWSGDPNALDAYKRRDTSSPALAPYLRDVA